MGLIVFVIFGAIVGWIASKIAGTDQDQGAIGNIIVGILGSFLGGIIMNMFGKSGVTGFNIGSFLVALLGAVILLLLYRAIRRPGHKPGH